MYKEHECLSIEFLSVLTQVLGEPSNTLALHEPAFFGNEINYLKDCIDTGWVSSVGKYVEEFEHRLAEFTGARYAIAVINGTAALHVALLLAGVQQNDEVIVPALSFVATANSVSHCGAVPHFVDSNKDTLGLDTEALALHLKDISEYSSGELRNRITGRRIAAIVPMHTFGHPVNMISLLEIAGHFGLPIVEDAAESLGSTYHGQHTGTFGRLGVLSFNGNKVITTGGGGAILTNDYVLACRAKHLTTTAKLAHQWEFFHDEIAYNYRLPNLNAALGCAQMECLPDMLKSKRDLAEQYMHAFESIAGLRFITEPEKCKSNYWLNAICAVNPDMNIRDQLLTAANNSGYQCRPVWTLLHKLPMYTACPRSELLISEILESSLINIPSSAKLLYSKE